MNNELTTAALRTIDLSTQYDCAASMSVLDFAIGSQTFRARRFCRADIAGSGKVEIYSIAPSYETCSEEFIGYANPSHASDLRVIRAIEAAEVSLPVCLIEMAA